MAFFDSPILEDRDSRGLDMHDHGFPCKKTVNSNGSFESTTQP